MIIEKYAPVVIPTLCRYEHFKRCIESLLENKYSENTHVIISLDYPSKESHWDGYRKIEKYLEDLVGFGKLTVIKRDKNLGALGNCDAVRDYGFSISDSIIFTEDDNVFSPNFLEYMNLCLQKYKNDVRIIWACGYSAQGSIPDGYSKNYYYDRYGCAWGVGLWKGKFDDYGRFYDIDFLKSFLRKKENVDKLRAVNPRFINYILSMIKTGDICGDAIVCCYSKLYDKYSIKPTISKVKNYGCDGTGAHSKVFNKNVVEKYKKEKIDCNSDFDFEDGNSQEGILKIDYPIKRNPFTMRQFIKDLIAKIDFYCLVLFNKIPHSKYI